ncbi:MAG: hypothetical protein WAO08_34185 [Hyphomicrobiaceae bacterium]
MADHSHDGGFGLGESGVRVTKQRALVEKLTADAARMNARYERTSKTWQAASLAQCV